jgi:CRISPR-associated protein Cmr4
MSAQLIFLLTRTPLHVGAGTGSGLIDEPCLRERHTGLPFIPGSALKGVLAQPWWDPKLRARSAAGLRWFGGTGANGSQAGLLQITEARLLAFPVRSARGGFAWITSPMALRRFARDGGMPEELLPTSGARDEQAWFARSSPLSLTVGSEARVVLEDYCFSQAGELPTIARAAAAPASPGAPAGFGAMSLSDHFRGLLTMDCVWREVGLRLVIVSDHMFSFFTRTTCELAAHARVDELSGVAAIREAYLQENVPAESLFYAGLSLHARSAATEPPPEAESDWESLRARWHQQVFQFGSDASTGLGFCSVELRASRPPTAS